MLNRVGKYNYSSSTHTWKCPNVGYKTKYEGTFNIVGIPFDENEISCW